MDGELEKTALAVCITNVRYFAIFFCLRRLHCNLVSLQSCLMLLNRFKCFFLWSLPCLELAQFLHVGMCEFLLLIIIYERSGLAAAKLGN